ncbi:MuF-like minor capsid protein [Gordonia phage VanLee]|uniref:MuF-like minor capsid protein n=1 Tax=Gordonia phage VanLee TaxID=2845816 RepID=A0A8F2D9B5_9CAUD|nr:MuF-like minor capsid protein [Gordonia phage VanLee]QWS68124.1 MuF-like minor capsid protein [Gordonia phage VanLee]
MNVGDAEYRILAALAKALTTGDLGEDWSTRTLARRAGLRKAISAILLALARSHTEHMNATTARDAIEAARKAEIAGRRLRRMAPTPSRAINPTVIAPPRRHSNLVREMMPTVLRSTDDVFRKVVAQVVATPVTTERERLDAVQVALDRLTRQGITGFVDRAGRRWNMTSYLEMATRTALRRAAEDWYAHELEKVGVDLVVVSEHPAPAPQCAPFQGRVLSLTGASVGPVGVSATGELIDVVASLAEARRRGYNHPNCRHHLLPFIAGDDYAHPRDVDPDSYKAEQRLRKLERAVRYAKSQSATAVTPERRSATQTKVRAAQAAVRDHVNATGTRRQRHREQLNAPR